MTILAASMGAVGPMSTGAADPVALSIYNKLVSWWEMDEASGSRNDSKGTNHLAVAGTVATAEGARGPGDVAAAFAGAGSLFRASNSSLQVPAGGGDHCLFGWFYASSMTGVQWVAGKWDATSAVSLEYGLDIESGELLAQNGGSTYFYPNPGPTPDAEAWHFAIMWRDAGDGEGEDDGKVRMSVDGGPTFLSAAASNPGGGGGSALQFGRVNAVLGLGGRLQRWGWIKDGFLSEEERTYLYNEGAGLKWAELAAAAGI
ncbi:MAG TPA: hypothetical protein VM619_14900 [Luteimonas sp.]|nr:hypothetical protein [Luteimonas sp.]